MKLFDKTQMILSICGVATLILSLITFVITIMTATPIYDENNALVKMVYLDVPQTLFTIFFFICLASSVWFLARLITYKMRKKEAIKDIDKR